MAEIDRAQEKWRKNVLQASEKWRNMVQRSDSLEGFVSGVADFAGLSESAVRSSIPAKNYKDFQANAGQYMDKFLRNIKRAAEKGKWKKGYKDAFSQ